VASVPAETATDWAPIDELFDIGTRNLAAEPVPERQVLDAAEGAAILVFAGDSLFVASRVVTLADLVDLNGARGAVVALPHRHTLLVHPVRDRAVVGALQTMIPLADRLYREGPGSLTPQLYWWHDNALTHLPATVDGRNVSFYPPDAFVRVLDELPPPPEA
jgi:hypothetical protein